MKTVLTLDEGDIIAAIVTHIDRWYDVSPTDVQIKIEKSFAGHGMQEHEIQKATAIVTLPHQPPKGKSE